MSLEIKCKQCQLVKDESEFSKVYSDGPREKWNLRKKCRSCSHDEYRERRSNPKRLKAMKIAGQNWKKENPAEHARLAREYRQRHPEKIIAQNRLNYAIKKGRVVRQPCEVCGRSDRVHAHHRTYLPEDWYNVKWLCIQCHKDEHAKESASNDQDL